MANPNKGISNNLPKGSGTLARNAVDLLSNVIDGLRVNDLDNYADSALLRSDFIRDENYIRDTLQNATRTAYDAQRLQALQDAVNAEDTNYSNTRNAIAEMRRNLIGSASSGANVGAANAAALQALLGLGAQNSQTTTEGLRNINNISRERAAALAQNAADAITMANDATGKMYDAATSAYASDRSYAAQGASQALGELLSAAENARANIQSAQITGESNEKVAGVNAQSASDVANIEGATQRAVTSMTNDAQMRMNADTNKTNLEIEKTPKVSKSTNKNYNYNRK
jgi:hypothetical protein